MSYKNNVNNLLLESKNQLTMLNERVSEIATFLETEEELNEIRKNQKKLSKMENEALLRRLNEENQRRREENDGEGFLP